MSSNQQLNTQVNPHSRNSSNNQSKQTHKHLNALTITKPTISQTHHTVQQANPNIQQSSKSIKIKVRQIKLNIKPLLKALQSNEASTITFHEHFPQAFKSLTKLSQNHLNSSHKAPGPSVTTTPHLHNPAKLPISQTQGLPTHLPLSPFHSLLDPSIINQTFLKS